MLDFTRRTRQRRANRTTAFGVSREQQLIFRLCLGITLLLFLMYQINQPGFIDRIAGLLEDKPPAAPVRNSIDPQINRPPPNQDLFTIDVSSGLDEAEEFFTNIEETEATDAPPTEMPASAEPTNAQPVSDIPVSEPPTTEPPTTDPPTTDPPTTDPPTTDPPTTDPPTTDPPPTEPPVPEEFAKPLQVMLDAPVDETGKYFPGVRPSLLEDVTDNILQSSDDLPARFNLMKLLEATDAQTLRQAAIPATRVDLMEQPDAYRGQLVTLEGTIRRAVELPPSRPGYPIEENYQLWFFPNTPPSRPTVVIALEVPEGFPVGKGEKGDPGWGLEESATVTGFFLKKLLYPADGESETDDVALIAPLVLARTVEWHPKPPEESRFMATMLTLIILVLIAGMLIVGVANLMTKPKLPEKPEEGPPPPETWDKVSEMDRSGE